MPPAMAVGFFLPCQARSTPANLTVEWLGLSFFEASAAFRSANALLHQIELKVCAKGCGQSAHIFGRDVAPPSLHVA